MTNHYHGNVASLLPLQVNKHNKHASKRVRLLQNAQPPQNTHRWRSVVCGVQRSPCALPVSALVTVVSGRNLIFWFCLTRIRTNPTSLGQATDGVGDQKCFVASVECVCSLRKDCHVMFSHHWLKEPRHGLVPKGAQAPLNQEGQTLNLAKACRTARQHTYTSNDLRSCCQLTTSKAPAVENVHHACTTHALCGLTV